MDRSRQLGRVVAVLLAVALAQVRAAPAAAVPSATGVDVSNYQGDVDFAQVRASGATFAFVLATDGTTFASPTFPDQYSDARAAGMFRGAYHFARPSASSGAAQADRFLDVIGWVRDPAERDGFTLPPVLDYEDVDGACAGLTPQQHVDWIRSFIDRVHERTARNPIIYTNRGTWQACTGDTTAFRDQRLWVAEWGVAAPALFGGWPRYSFWQTTDSGSVPGITGPVDLNVYEGEITLQQLADAGAPPPAPAAGGTIEPTTGWVSSQIGNRCPGPDADHYGIDIAADPWTSVLSVYDGTVEAIVPAAIGGAAGNHVVIAHRNGWVSKYFHLAAFQGGLQVGQAIAKGGGVGFVGDTGAGTGPHLHFEMRQLGSVVLTAEMNAHYACGRWVDRGQPSPVDYDGLG